MQNIRIPGLAWVILIVCAISGIYYFEDQLPFDPLLWNIVTILLFGALKSIKLGTEELNQALDLLETVRVTLAKRRGRSAPDVSTAEAPAAEMYLAPESIPERPNKLLTFLFG